MDTTTLRNDAIAGAQTLPDLVMRLQAVDPTLAAQLVSKPLVMSKTPVGVLVVTAIVYVSSKYALGWDQGFCELLGGAGLVLGAYVMRWFSSRPIAGIFTKKETT